MKIFLLALTMLLSVCLKAQNHEIDLSYRVGISTNSITSPELVGATHYDYRRIGAMNDQGVILMYKYKLFKKLNLFVSTGIEFSKSKLLLPLFGYRETSRLLDNVEINTNRIGYRIIGLTKRFNLIEDKLSLDIACNVVKRIYSTDNDNYNSDYRFNTTDWIKYKYNIDLFMQDDNFAIRLNTDFGVNLNFKVTENLKLNFGANFSRNYETFYNYTYSVNYYQGGSETPTEEWNYGGLRDGANSMFRATDDYLYLRTGLTFSF